MLFVLLAAVRADIYLQTPRGSNNKLNEQQNNVQNDNRLYDSQNNANAGYQVGDACIPNCLDGNNQYQPNYPGAGEGVMQYYEGSYLWIDWTNQHGSQHPMLHNQFVLQYMCDDGPYSDGLRDGKTTNTIPLNPGDPNILTFGQHENFRWYDECRQRQRNGGLYLADQNLQGNTAIYTRQNANGQRFGYECTEERDYYPYWHPTPWRDVWVCSDTATQCPMYQQNSQNVRNFNFCSNPIYNNEKDCVNNRESWREGGSWNTFAPNCTVCPKTRPNHNGNTMGEDNSPGYMWQIPEGLHRDGAKCVIRVRYNITTKDFPSDAWNVFSNSNGANSPVRNNPVNDFVGLGLNVSGPIRLNINTAQVGRTFEDRSHVFQIRKRPSNLKCGLRTSASCRIFNLNVRGRRGNIQQTYPAVEYDFVPTTLAASKGDFLHIQWTGSDANSQGNAGNGRTGTDRNNMVLISNMGRNYPQSFSPLLQNRPNHFTNNQTLIGYLAFLNQTGCNDEQTNTNANDNCKTLNRAPAYIDVGLVQLENTGVFHYMSTRNNAFSNRDQKATLIVEEDIVTVGAGIGIGIAGIVMLSLGSIFTLRYAKRNPDTKLGAMYKIVKSNEVLTDDMTAPSSPGSDSDNELDVDEKKSLAEKHPWVAKLVEWYAWRQPRILFWTFFLSCQTAAWLYGYFLNRANPSPFFGFAKGFGKVLDFNMGFILLPVLRNFLSYLRTTAAGDKLPLDDNIRMHKWTGYAVGISALGHIAMHFLNYYWALTNFATPIYISLFTNLPGITGVIVTILMLCMFSTAFLKRKIYSLFGNRFDGYRTFLQMHRLWVVVYAVLFLHGAQFWQWAIFPLLFIAIEKYIQSRVVKQDVKILDAKLVGKDILALKMQLLNGKKKFRYKAGQYLFLCCPDINESEFHPFTITSAPEESFFSCHIRCRPDMDWTYALRRHVLEAQKKDEESKDANVIVMENRTPTGSTPMLSSPVTPTGEYEGLVLRIDGPYGSASEEVFDFDTVILVGAGIGVTPFISILKSISMRLHQSEARMSIYFYWICRDQQEFDSFKDFFDQIIKIKELEGLVELNMYVTGELNLKSVKAEAYNQFSGRPNWNRIFKEMAKRHQGSEIGVFLCGPAALAPELANASKKHSTKRSKALMKGKHNIRTIFKFHKENF